jgi:dienelactone hydrolase
VLILHGSHGFAEEYVRLARDLARSGVVAVAACWFEGGVGVGARFVKSLPCPDAPPIVRVTPAALDRIDALVAAVRALPGVRPDRVALFGHSRGGGAALMYALGAGGVRALVLNSTGYPPEVVARAPDVAAPILLLHGTRDDPVDGGSALTAVDRARAFEAALRAAGKEVDATYFEAGHNDLFASAAQYDATVRRIRAFLRQQLIP